MVSVRVQVLHPLYLQHCAVSKETWGQSSLVIVKVTQAVVALIFNFFSLRSVETYMFLVVGRLAVHKKYSTGPCTLTLGTPDLMGNKSVYASMIQFK